MLLEEICCQTCISSAQEPKSPKRKVKENRRQQELQLESESEASVAESDIGIEQVTNLSPASPLQVSTEYASGDSS